jgi:2-dehydro-3-deoxyglucarate aldolase/4-hydroxy-2-oxoheptanedioate aldolase
MARIVAVGPLANHKLIEIAGMHGGYHGVWIDQEHAALTLQQIEVLALACRSAGLDSYVRLAPTDYATVMRPMEAGVGGIMAAQIRSVEEVRRVVAWAKYPPQGIRGLNISNFEGNWATADAGEFVVRANRDRWVAIQIETLEALNQVEEIAKVEGVDHLFVGPLDLSISLGVPAQYLHAKCVGALERVSAAARAAGKTWGIVPRGPEHAAKCRELGCLLFAFALDLGLVHLGFRATRATYQDFFQDD